MFQFISKRFFLDEITLYKIKFNFTDCIQIINKRFFDAVTEIGSEIVRRLTTAKSTHTLSSV